MIFVTRHFRTFGTALRNTTSSKKFRAASFQSALSSDVLSLSDFKVVRRHPDLLEMELDVLYNHVASPPVVANFSALAQRIANKRLPHGADIIVGIHSRLLKESYPLPLKLAPVPSPSLSGPLRKEPEARESVTLEDEDKIGPPHRDETSSLPGVLAFPSESKISIPTPPPLANLSAPISTLNKEPPKPAGINNATTTAFQSFLVPPFPSPQPTRVIPKDPEVMAAPRATRADVPQTAKPRAVSLHRPPSISRIQ